MVVNGDIQCVGYRALVKQVARKLGVKGVVRNLDNGTVEIFCEANNGTLKEFEKQINIRAGPGLFSINVEKINIYLEGDKGYQNPPPEFKVFEIDYRTEAETQFEKANLERLEIGTLVMSSFRDETRSSFGRLDETMSSFKSETNQNFNKLDEKYGEISGRMLDLAGKLDKALDRNNRAMESLGQAILKAVESIKEK